MLCPTCSALRWRPVLHHAAAFATRELARTLTSTAAAPGHGCDRLTGERTGGPAGWPLFPAIDRWGAIAVPPVPALSVRAMEGLLRAAGRGAGGAPRAADTRAAGREHRAAGPGPAPAPATLDPGWHARGLRAPAAAGKDLTDVLDRLDDLDAAPAEFAARTQFLLDAVADGNDPPA